MYHRALRVTAILSLYLLNNASAFAEAKFEPLPLEVVWSTPTEDPHGRTMKIKNDFSFIDSSGKRWLAPGGSIVDGASIPRVFWSLLGGPYEGLYRDASVVHDVACVTRTRRWEDVHLMFYEAMLISGVSINKAKIMYAAVYYFGPRWTLYGKLDSFSTSWGKSRSVEEQLAIRGDLAQRIGNENVPSFGKIPPMGHKQEEIHRDEIKFLNRLASEIENKNLTLNQIENFKKYD